MASPAALGYIKMVELHDYVQFFLVVILFFVLWFYVNIILDFGDFNTKQAPKELLKRSYTHIKARNIAHLGWLEVVWTIIPIFILTAIAIPSFKLLYALDVVNSPLLTLRCIGNQWYWTYECDIVKPELDEAMRLHLDKEHFFIQTQTWNTLENSKVYGIKTILSNVDFIPAMSDFVDILANDAAVIKNSETFEYTFDLGLNSVIIHPFMTDGPHYYVTHINVPEISTKVMPIINTEISDTELNLTFTKNTIEETIIADLMNLYHQFTDDTSSFAIDSYMLDADELQLGAFRLLEVDNYPILPADAEIRLAVTGTDVIHSYAVPSLGVKVDAIPGRLNQFGIRVRSPGTYYGQCSELCGVGHGFMPIKIQFNKVHV